MESKGVDFGYKGNAEMESDHHTGAAQVRSEAMGSGNKGLDQCAGPAWLRWDRKGECGKRRAFALPGGDASQAFVMCSPGGTVPTWDLILGPSVYIIFAERPIGSENDSRVHFWCALDPLVTCFLGSVSSFILSCLMCALAVEVAQWLRVLASILT